MARRHSLLVRLLAVSVLIAACSITATAWLAAQSTTGSIQREYGQALATDARIYDTLLGYAATHKDWNGVQPTVAELARQNGRRIVLTTEKRQPIADSAPATGQALPPNQTAVVDPLAVDLTLKPGSPTDRIDPRAAGPYRLTPAERQTLRRRADRALACARARGATVTVADLPNGHRQLRAADDRSSDTLVRCEEANDAEVLYTPTKTEQAADAQLFALIKACLARQGVDVRDRLTRVPGRVGWVEGLRNSGDPRLTSCVDTARREQLDPHVAPPALLFLTVPAGGEAPRIDLSGTGTKRIALAALAVLAVTVCVATLAAARVVRPIQALTAAAQRMGDGDRSVRVEGVTKGELGQLAQAFNTMSARLAETENQRKVMVSDIAHELRSPLVNIRGWLEATQDGVATLDPELVSSLLEEAVLLQYLVDDLRDLALADAGALRLHPEPVDAAELIDQVAAAHRGHAEDKRVTLGAETRGDLTVTADPARLRQALGNLVSNAVRYTPPGGEVTVAGYRGPDHVLLEVTDTGVGISPEDLPHVFDRFWRADKSRNRQTGGSGLGLAITRHLAEAHGGSVVVSSTPGEGSTFSILLPAASLTDDRRGTPPPGSSSRTSG